LEEVIARNLDALFPGMEIISHNLFRVTRDADFEISDGADDLMQAVEDELRRRRFGEVVRVEVGADIEPDMRERRIDWLAVSTGQVYEQPDMLDLTDLWQIVGIDGHTDLRQTPWTPITHPALKPRTDDEDSPADVFAVMRRKDLLLHYPYQSFST